MLNMTPTIFRNLFSQRATRLYPIEKRDTFKDVRGELIFDVEKCTFCVRCQMACPSQCITVDRKAATWECDSFACVYCGVCSDTCPDGALHHEEAYRPVSREKGKMFFQGVLKAKPKKEAAEPKAEAAPKADAKVAE